MNALKGIFSVIGVSFLLLLVGSEARAQGPDSQNPSVGGDSGMKMDTTFSVLPIREDDKMYQISVWRRIDLREKFNLPFYGTGGLKLGGIMRNILQAVENMELTPYADEDFTTELSITDFQSNFWINEIGDSIFVRDLYYVDFKEDFIFDKNRSETKFDVKYIILTMPSETNSNAGERTIGFFKYKDFYEHFKNHPDAKWVNYQNPSKNIPYSQAFDLRLFRSVVRKYTNPDNALIADMVDNSDPNAKMQAYLKSLEFEYKLLEWENDLWEW
ncbi:gliding motility protein GldN [Lunatimonas salinarum]|uniref:type IX secretion system ring protein PorN/GldN n=1 Tax=Lunatimonas salinarum TaxID=1774590 RepID=UPI001ADF49B9|nr:gliding motility protein GldN [Lunatimonas salinarum]